MNNEIFPDYFYVISSNGTAITAGTKRSILQKQFPKNDIITGSEMLLLKEYFQKKVGGNSNGRPWTN